MNNRLSTPVPPGAAKRPARILLLTGEIGDGHIHAARALEAAAARLPEDMAVRVSIRDIISWTRPSLHAVSRWAYVQLVKRLPSVWGFFFERTRRPSPAASWLRKFRLIEPAAMAALIRSESPDLIISTIPMASAVVADAKRAGGTDVPLATVITDHTDHPYWIHPGTDLYLVGSEGTARLLADRGISRDAIRVTGIPVHPRYDAVGDRDELRIRHGLDPGLPTIMVMGGGHGVISREVLDLFRGDALSRPVQALIVCGHNARLREKLEREASRNSRHKIVPAGYIPHVHEWMALSDLLISKAGGLTTSEALASRLPMLLYKPIPGQETDNAEWLVSVGAAKRAANSLQLAALANELLARPDQLEQMRLACARAAGPGRSAERTLLAAMSLLDGR
ncbi:glycosyltransferase [Paenibacillus thermoaerophilus]|uniref:Glycosyltransferase n=1 Tax=Paenibacillus thermoaerophilus TaxID=1215385 RepID=A0ABW2V0H2_9BACL|nr:glycosyltransferase [Paenibacillus thermoaerophilus]TMV11036.1 galactosyldiacylglycerol synthase [Paenibacillus thermoaerophilus]